MTPSPLQTIETRASWVTASVALWLMTMAFGANWITSVALTTIAAEVNGTRSVPALAMSLTWLGAAVGGILMGRIANRIGIRWTVIGGSLMIAIGLTISTIGPPWPLRIGHGLFMGLIGLSGINAPMYIYTSQWFDRRRGSALALISSGSYFAGALWPPIFERAVAYIGWRHTMLTYAVLEMVVIIPLALIFLKPPPEITLAATGHPAAHLLLDPAVVVRVVPEQAAGVVVRHPDVVALVRARLEDEEDVVPGAIRGVGGGHVQAVGVQVRRRPGVRPGHVRRKGLAGRVRLGARGRRRMRGVRLRREPVLQLEGDGLAGEHLPGGARKGPVVGVGADHGADADVDVGDRRGERPGEPAVRGAAHRRVGELEPGGERGARSGAAGGEHRRYGERADGARDRDADRLPSGESG